MRWLTRRNSRLIATVVLTTLGVLMITPANGVTLGIVAKITHAMRHIVAAPKKQLKPDAANGQSFNGSAAVGALFSTTNGKLDQHFCTGSVIDSRGGDLVLTAAHCVTGVNLSSVVFVPAYSDGRSPYGIWPVKKIFTDRAWRSTQDPDDDVAFLQLNQSKAGVPIEDITGAEQLGTGWPSHEDVQVIGYPDGEAQPLWCSNWATSFSPTQMQFNCGGYTDGTSGGPFLADVNSSTGQGTVIGVIGGYEQGGYTPSVSYAAVFGSNVSSLYSKAVAGS